MQAVSFFAGSMFIVGTFLTCHMLDTLLEGIAWGRMVDSARRNQDLPGPMDVFEKRKGQS
jgi:hypothetical protein